ncbi:response regulator transcription factor [Fastidiosipila sanguinis]|uniref:Stage 0 sporulation protein A homolog n=1 Tax=Fastidiosipila sanguinis TaxID=236753 RepID=A0A2S0KPH1_9FIRM|nr:response regulator transcription factor [Fastidiosipila sanguinis]AVM42926.1 DNA-binding response regulator [Fastidiosipila sanguinis]
MPLIYIVDDEANIRRLASLALEEQGMEVRSYENGEQLLGALDRSIPDCILLDWMMPGLDGIQLLHRIRNNDKFKNIPLIMLTAKSEEMDVVMALELGADDYISKPFGIKELPARVRAVLRRQNRASEDTQDRKLSASGITIDPKRHSVVKNGVNIDLTAREFDLLYVLMESPGRVFTRDTLLNQVWDTEYFGDTRTVDVHIRYLRQKIENDDANPVYIKTIRGVGYSFADSEE